MADLYPVDTVRIGCADVLWCWIVGYAAIVYAQRVWIVAVHIFLANERFTGALNANLSLSGALVIRAARELFGARRREGQQTCQKRQPHECGDPKTTGTLPLF